jgi:hypothetical protein
MEKTNTRIMPFCLWKKWIQKRKLRKWRCEIKNRKGREELRTPTNRVMMKKSHHIILAMKKRREAIISLRKLFTELGIHWFGEKICENGENENEPVFEKGHEAVYTLWVNKPFNLVIEFSAFVSPNYFFCEIKMVPSLFRLNFTFSERL